MKKHLDSRFRGNDKRIWLTLFFLFLNTLTAFAVSYDIKEMTPEITSALQDRQSRYDQIQHLKSEGVIGESNDAYVKVLKPIPEADDIVRVENQDRKTIYRAIADQNQLGSAGLTQVQKAFASVQREKARPGDSIQLPSGEWKKK